MKKWVLTAVVATIVAAAAAVPAAASAVTYPILSTNFDDQTYGSWEPFGLGADRVQTVASDGGYALKVVDRDQDWVGIRSASGLLKPSTTYIASARVRLVDGAPAARARFVVTPGYAWVGDAAVTSTAWTTISGTFTTPAAGGEAARVYIGTSDTGAPYSYLVDDLVITVDTTLKATTTFPVGVAIDSRETTGAAGSLVAANFDQITAENSMKPDGWYDAQRTFRMNSDTQALMDFAVQNALAVHGHTLVWHGQTPDWFFQNAAGQPLTTSETDRQTLRDRMRAHIDNVARTLAEQYGPYGGGNPLRSFDVVNEVIADGPSPESDGLRPSEWYRILGPEFIDLAFTYADQAFNHTYAAAGAQRPVSLYINDYATEVQPKRARLIQLVNDLRARSIPIDGVGHQFHVALGVPVANLAAALQDVGATGLRQMVTELDVATGTPVTAQKLTEQGQYYRDAFAVFRSRTDIASVSVWGLNDGRSWRSTEGAPLLFDDQFQAKPAFAGAAGLLDPVTSTPEVVAPTITVTATSRCVSGKVQLVTQVKNVSTAPVTATVSSTYGSRTTGSIAPGATVAVTSSTRQASIGATALQVSWTATGGATGTVSATAPAKSCAG